MNWLAYLSAAITVAESIASIAAAISSGQPASTPPVNTYIDGKHGSISITWTPIT